ncbi:hypothetical protein NECAME_03295 [Necator americanus]|uniref:Uncharacterized protein n=1 Tax=Necator americanus TaxID=51031 RepID=W2T590_NECAM|nr:hypothetical protein NECAME_03295 [Necator americanus]ETN77195.1 hypothetical protein NECAME_03295 [Necator americanus]
MHLSQSRHFPMKCVQLPMGGRTQVVLYCFYSFLQKKITGIVDGEYRKKPKIYELADEIVVTIQKINLSATAGLGSEVFMKPQPRSVKKGSQQFMEMYDGLRQGAIKVKTVWVQVTSPIEWSPDTKANINFLNDLLSTAKSYGIAIGLYTNVYDWTQITNGASASEGTMLWYWNVNGNGPNGETPANFHDFRPFAKFTNPTVKQFAQVETVCGVTVNRDVYVLNRSTRTLASGPVDSKGELVVGSLGDAILFQISPMRMIISQHSGVKNDNIDLKKIEKSDLRFVDLVEASPL